MTQFRALFANKNPCRIKTVVRPFGITSSQCLRNVKILIICKLPQPRRDLIFIFILTVNGMSIETVHLNNFRSHSMTTFCREQLGEQGLLELQSFYFERAGNDVLHFSLKQKRATSRYWRLRGERFQTNILQKNNESRVSLDYKEANISSSLQKTVIGGFSLHRWAFIVPVKTTYCALVQLVQKFIFHVQAPYRCQSISLLPQGYNQ